MASHASQTKSPTRTTSPARVAANRRNAKRSTGPRTQAGKDVSRFNAVKHGLRAVIPVLPGEDAERLRERRDAWVAAANPADPIELYLVETAVAESWALDRARTLEAEATRAAARAGAPAAPPPFDPQTAFARLVQAPRQAAAEFAGCAAGRRWLRDRWAALADALESRGAWDAGEYRLAVRLAGWWPELDAALQDGLSESILQAVLALGWPTCRGDHDGWTGPLAQLTGEPVREQGHGTLGELARFLAWHAPQPAEARAALERIIAEARAGLDAADAAPARGAEEAPADPSAPPADPLRAPDAALRQRYTASHRSALFQALRLLTTLRRESADRPAFDWDTVQEPEETPAPVPEAPAPNEPISDAGPESVETSDPIAGPRRVPRVVRNPCAPGRRPDTGGGPPVAPRPEPSTKRRTRPPRNPG